MHKDQPGSAVITLVDWDAVQRISGGDPANFADHFLAKTNVAMKEYAQEFVMACHKARQENIAEREDAINRAVGQQGRVHETEKRTLNGRIEQLEQGKQLAERQRDAEVKSTKTWKYITWGAAACLVLSLFFVASHTLSHHLDARAEAAHAREQQRIDAAKRAAENANAVSAFGGEVKGCWKAFANQRRADNCWRFDLNVRGGDVAEFTCYRGKPQAFTFSADRVLAPNGDSYTSADGLLLQWDRDRALVAVYNRCTSDGE